MYTVEYVGKGITKLQQFPNNALQIIKNTNNKVFNTSGKAMFNDINNATHVKTGRLKRGNILQVSENGLHYWNKVPYAKFMDQPRFGAFITANFNKHKVKIMQDWNMNFGSELKAYFSGV